MKDVLLDIRRIDSRDVYNVLTSANQGQIHSAMENVKEGVQMVMLLNHTTKHIHSGTFVLNRVMFMFRSDTIQDKGSRVEVFLRVIQLMLKPLPN